MECNTEGQVGDPDTFTNPLVSTIVKIYTVLGV